MVNNQAHFITRTYEGLLPTPPAFDIRHLDSYPKQYEDYFDLSFQMKPWMVGLNSRFKMQTFNLSPHPDKVIVGKDRWLFIAGDKMDAYRGVQLYTPDELEKIKKQMHRRAAYAKEKFGTKMYFVILPLKQSVYPEYLPMSAQKLRDTTKYDQVMKLFENDSLVKLIEVKQELLDAKSSHLLYYKTDNHWNDIGGYVAYKKIASVLQKDFPAVQPAGLDRFLMDSTQVAVGGEARMLNVGDWLHEYKYEYNPGSLAKAKEGAKRGYPPTEGFPYPWDYEIVRTTGDSLLPDALIFRDSFTDALLPFLAENFNRSVFIFDAWQYKANFDMVDTEKPDVIIYITIETDLDAYLKYD